MIRFRDALTGWFTTRKDADARPANTTSETFTPNVTSSTLEDEVTRVILTRVSYISEDIARRAARRVLLIPRIRQALFALDQIEASGHAY
jgi:hypothetical protein